MSNNNYHHGGLKQVINNNYNYYYYNDMNINSKLFNDISKMIFSKQNELKILSYDSLSGFIYLLKLPHTKNNNSNIQFYDINNHNSRFNIPVHEFIIKISVLSSRDSTSLKQFMNCDKMTMSPNTFHDEAKFQQKAWIESIIGGRDAICPSIANFTLLQQNDALHFFGLLNKYKHTNTKSTEHLLNNYLINIMNTKHYIPSSKHNNKIVDDKIGIGFIIMSLKNNATVFENEIFKLKKNINNNKYSLIMTYAMVISNLLRLSLEMKIFHIDFHDRNVLFYNDKLTNEKKSIIIDFGRASDIKNIYEHDEYFTISEKKSILKQLELFYDQLFTLDIVNNDDYNYKIIHDILYFIKEWIDKANRKQFEIRTEKHLPLYWIDTIPYPKETLLMAYNLYKEKVFTISDNISKKTINKYQKLNLIFDINKNINSYYCNDCLKHIIPYSAIFKSKKLKLLTKKKIKSINKNKIKSIKKKKI